MVYQEARRLLAATFQAITYKEFLPLVLGDEIMKKYELEVKEGTDSSFDQSLDPTIWNEFATFAYRCVAQPISGSDLPVRFGHTLVPSKFERVNNRRQRSTIEEFHLRNTFFNITFATNKEKNRAWWL